MTAFPWTSEDHSAGSGRPQPSKADLIARRGADERAGVPTSAPERPKSWVARIVDAMTKPVEPNFDNP